MASDSQQVDLDVYTLEGRIAIIAERGRKAAREQGVSGRE